VTARESRDEFACLTTSLTSTLGLVVKNHQQTKWVEYENTQFDHNCSNTVRSSHAKVQHGRNNILNKPKQDIATAMVDKKSKDTATTSTIDGPTMTLRSGRVIGKWHIAQARIPHNKSIVGDNIKFKFTDPPDPRFKPMSDVFNTPKLLEQILLNLRPGFLLENAQKVCRGFKDSIDGPPTFRKRAAFALNVHDVPNAGYNKFSFGLMPRFLVGGTHCAGHLRFSFSDDTRLFEDYMAMERFRRLRVFDRVPQRLSVDWFSANHQDNSLSWEVNTGGDPVTFGEIFDVVAGLDSSKKAASSLDIIWQGSDDEWDPDSSIGEW